jgi:cell fate regulator YaaT (PSP1 superfamily)
MCEHDYLVSYGLGGYLGRFRSSMGLTRDDRVVVRTLRGIEIGMVLGRAPEINSSFDSGGEVVRVASHVDVANAASLQERAGQILNATIDAASALPILFLDCEILLDGNDAILHAVHWAECDVTPLIEELSQRTGLAIKVADLTTTPKQGGCSVCGAEKSGCDSCGTGGGCSSGSCSRGSIKNADDLTAYFAGLRKQMEAADQRVSLH